MNRTPLSRIWRGLCALALFAALSGLAACAPKVQLPMYDDAGSDFAAFRARFAPPLSTGGGVSVRTSLLYTTPKNSNRTEVQIFGDYARPLRLDVRAGLGSMLALMREDGAGLLAYYPDKKKAYAHQDPVIGAQLLGLPFPFSLQDLSHILSGQFRTLIPVNQPPDSIIMAGDGSWAFTYKEGPVRLLMLDSHGRPERMEGILSPYFKTQAEREKHLPAPPGRAWAITFSDYPEEDGDPEGPARTLTLALPGGESAVLRVKSLEARAGAWPVKALTLNLPGGTGFMALDRQTAPPPGVTSIITGENDSEPEAKGKPHG